MNKIEIAWCGGFYEGEGHASAGISYQTKTRYHTYCRAMVNQKHKDVLLRFKRGIGFGKVAGPYQPKDKSRCPLYVWRVSSRADVSKLYSLLKPYLSRRRKQQFQRALKGEFN